MTEQEVIADIIRREGGFSDRPADKGGPTQYGITKATYEAFIGRAVSLEEFKANCTIPIAERIYSERYLPSWRWIPDERLRALLVDWSITSGADDPTRALQRATGVKVDGVLGQKTKDATLAGIVASRDNLFREVLRLRMEFYIRVALSDTAIRLSMEINPKLQIHNLKGWINRCAEFTV